MQKFGEKLRALRTQRGLTTRELGSILDVDQSYITRMENGKRHPNIVMAIKIADIFDVTVDQLVRDEIDLE
ncbi:helix-turn-helix domain-containing protein [Chloroflexi bacterium TSY]|nr:helix-turn-helix domain-containing protein [Chloroflexi bacterium TSY]